MPMLGETTSRMAKTAAATTPRERISSSGSERRGMKRAAAATKRPSTKYLITRFTISEVASMSYISSIDFFIAMRLFI
jgi:hypothetical protein